jgi:DNA transformation protein
MAVSPHYRDYVIEQLAAVGAVTAKSMFGGVGLYRDGVFFGLVANDTLYFKVDALNQAGYEAAGMGPFKPYPNRPGTMSYYEVPAGVLEDTDELRTWADAALRAATSKKAPRTDEDNRRRPGTRSRERRSARNER